YVIAGSDLVPAAGVHHYAPDRHALEQRCACPVALDPHTALVALTSIHWREAWKYGERAFRYCQHDLGHAIAAIRLAAPLVGCTPVLAPEWSHRDIAALTGIDRDADYEEAEQEEPGCLMVVTCGPAFAREEPGRASVDRHALIGSVRRGVWTGRAS